MPPAAVTVAAPVLPPKQSTSETTVPVVKAAAGCVMVTVLVIVHELASVTVTVLIPAFRVEITELVAAVDQR